jgi:hypothetical protein
MEREYSICMEQDYIHMVGDSFLYYKSSVLDGMLVDYSYVRSLAHVELLEYLDEEGYSFHHRS